MSNVLTQSGYRRWVANAWKRAYRLQRILARVNEASSWGDKDGWLDMVRDFYEENKFIPSEIMANAAMCYHLRWVSDSLQFPMKIRNSEIPF